jgi:integral membrane protein (TIGR01906 family)
MKPLLVVLICILLSLFVLLTDSHFTNGLLENDEAKEPTKQLVKHFFFLAPMPSVFNEQESAHMTDVAWLVRVGLFVLILTSILLLALKPNARTIYYGTGILIGFLAILMLLPFDSIFTQFHQIFFPQGNWQFAADSTIIQFYPFEFFFKYAVFIGAYSLLTSFVFCAFAFFSTRNKQ